MWRTSAGLEQAMDIRLYDETYYLTQGMAMPVSSWLADYGPLYSLYYKVASLFMPDPIGLYYLNYRVWALVFSLSVFYLLWWRSGYFWFALVWGLCAMCAQLNYPVWPKAGHFAMLLVTCGILGWWRFRREPALAWCWVSAVCLVVSWCRPEFFVGFILCLVPGLLAAFRSANWLKTIATCSLFFIPAWVAMGSWGLPVGRSGRAIVAFGQHFVQNRFLMDGRPASDLVWEWVNWRTHFNAWFGQSNSVVSAFFQHPKLVVEHMLYNFKYLIYNSFVYFSETLLPMRVLGIPVLTGVAVVWFCAEWLSGFEGISTGIKSLHRKRLAVLLPLAGFLIGPISGAIIFQPRMHYILPVLPIFLFLIGSLCTWYSMPSRFTWAKSVVWPLAGTLVLVFMPDVNAFYEIKESATTADANQPPTGYFEPITSPALANQQKLRFLGKLSYQGEVAIFDGSTGAAAFIKGRYLEKGKTGFEMDYVVLENFQAFLKTEDISVVYVAETQRFDLFFTRNSSYQEFVATAVAMGWKRLNLPDSKDYLLYRNKAIAVGL